MKSWDNKGAFDAARERVMELLRGKTIDEIQAKRCKSCVWPKEMYRLAQKPRKNSENQ